MSTRPEAKGLGGLFWGQDGSGEVQVVSCWGMLARFGSFWILLEALGGCWDHLEGSWDPTWEG